MAAPAPEAQRAGAHDVKGRLGRFWVKCIASGRYDRLEGAWRVAQKEIERRKCDDAKSSRSAAAAAEPEKSASWVEAAESLLTEARHALDRGRLDQGWRLLHAARRAEILALGKEEREQRATVLRAEADKLRSWRQKAVQRLLGTPEKPETNVGASALFEAATIRDEHYDNQAYKDRLLRTQMLVLVLVLAAVMVPLLWVMIRRATADGGDGNSTGAASFGLVALFGLLGATISGMLRASDASQSARIPELTAAIRVTFMRILMGSASAVMVYVFLQSGLGSGIGKSLFSESITSAVGELKPYTAYAIAFVAGFSERLVVRAVEAVAGKTENKSKAGSAS